MSIVSINRAIPAVAEARELVSDKEIFVVEQRLKVEKYEQDQVKYAQDQGRDMVGHFVEFIEGNRENFSSYFMTTFEHHVHQHEGFWDEIRNNYPDMVRLTFPDKAAEPDKPAERVRQHIFGDLGVMLRETVHFDQETGEEYDAMYSAERLPLPMENLGRVATAHIMQ